MIGKVQAKFDSLKLCEDNSYDISFKLSSDSRYNVKRIVEEIKAVTGTERGEVTLTIDKLINKRSLAQNRLLWALLEKMAEHFNAGRTGGVTAGDCYINMLEKFGSKYEYFMCIPEAVSTFKKEFRAVKEVERREYNGKEMIMCKCFIGSSKYDSKEMTLLIEGVLDTLTELGIDDTIMAYYREENERTK